MPPTTSGCRRLLGAGSGRVRPSPFVDGAFLRRSLRAPHVERSPQTSRAGSSRGCVAAGKLRATRQPSLSYALIGWSRLSTATSTAGETKRSTAASKQLNAFILSIASVSRNRELYSLGVRDLPPLMLGYRREPLLAEGGKTAPRERFAFVLHERIPGDVQLLTRTDAEAALSISALREVIPFATAGDFLLSAWHEFDRGRYGQASIDAATCIELLVVATIRELAPLVGHSQTKDRQHRGRHELQRQGAPLREADRLLGYSGQER